MKRIISLILSVVMTAALLTGCTLFERDQLAYNSQVIVKIASVTQTVTPEIEEFDFEINKLVRKVAMKDGKPLQVEVSSPEITILKSQLINYVNNYAGQYMNEYGYTLEKAVETLLDMLISTELVIIEADKLFYAGNLYWTIDDINDIQHSVYSTIDEQIRAYANSILERNNEAKIDLTFGEEEAASPTYPLMPEEDNGTNENLPEKYYGSVWIDGTEEYGWHDKWYTDDKWYIEDEKFLSSYPGMHGNTRERSLMREAMNAYLDEMYNNSQYIIGITKEDQKTVDAEIEALKKVQQEQGPEYTYPILGKTLLFKYLIGNSSIKSAKMEKLQTYRANNLVDVSEAEVTEYYNDLLAQQKRDLVTMSTYDAAVKNNETVLYTPSDRYLFVKHILLPFSDDQKAELERIKTREGKNEDVIEKERLRLVNQIVVYPHKNGEDDLTKPRSVKQVWDEVKAAMASCEGSAKRGDARDAEREFDRLIYKYNTDPGIFDNAKGYGVVYELLPDESETYMVEFAEGSRAFRDESYKPGQILSHYVVTDYGVHIMYYASDPKAGSQKGLKDYLTPGQYKTVYQTLEAEIQTNKQTNAYSRWEKKFISDTREKYATINEKRIEKFIKDLSKG